MSALVAALAARARETPEALALVGARTFTYRELVAEIDGVAAALAEDHRVGAGDRVASALDDGEDTVVLLFACAALGATIVPLNTRLSEPEIADLLRAARPVVTIGDRAFGTAVAMPRGRGIGTATARESHAPGRRAPVVILFTSGSTGAPKGVCIDEAHVLANAVATRDAWGLRRDDVTVNAAPMFHAGGLFVLTVPMLLVGATVHLEARFDAAAWAARAIAARATIGFGVPVMLERLAREPAFGDVAARSRLWVSGGAPCPRAVFDAFRARGARLVSGFGMTEVGPNCFRPVEGMDDASVGVPALGLEARLVRDGRAVDEGEDGEGELWLRGLQVARGYFEREDATKAAFEDGFVRTGDVFARKNGLYYVTGRLKEMYISGGENVYAGEVERVLLLHPAIREAAIVGAPDPTWGEVGHAFVVPRAPVDEAEVRAFVRERLAAYKVPKRVFALDELPRTGSGKVAKAALARHAC